MSGLFTRLANQARGRAATLHAPARLPFAPAPEALEKTPDPPHEQPVSDEANDAPAPLVATPATALARPELAPVDDASGLVRSTQSPAIHDPSITHTPQPASAAAAEAPDDTVNTPDNTTPTARHADRRPARQTDTLKTAQTQTAHRDAAAAPMASTKPEDAPDDHTPTTSARRDRAAVTTTAMRFEFDPPTPLLPARHPAAATQPPGPAPSSPRAARESTERLPDVHVHIGRIEVTAVPEAPPKPRAKPRTGRAPMSLDEYIARRERRST